MTRLNPGAKHTLSLAGLGVIRQHRHTDQLVVRQLLPPYPEAVRGRGPMSTFVILGIVAAVALYAISIYNRLVKNRQMVEEGWSGIDVQLKRRADLIPNLVNAVKGYMKHEKELLENITRLRAGAVAAEGSDPETRAKAENALSGGLMKLNAVMENYPDLKANENVMDLQNSLSEIEDEIQMSRRYYNGSARNMNILVESFPSNLIANYFKFIKAQYFEIEESTDRNVPTVEF